MSREDYIDEDEARSDWDNDIRNPRFMQNMANDVRKKHGDKAHLYAVEQILEREKDGNSLSASIWREVLNNLDQGEGQ